MPQAAAVVNSDKKQALCWNKNLSLIKGSTDSDKLINKKFPKRCRFCEIFFHVETNTLQLHSVLLKIQEVFALWQLDGATGARARRLALQRSAEDQQEMQRTTKRMTTGRITTRSIMTRWHRGGPGRRRLPLFSQACGRAVEGAESDQGQGKSGRAGCGARRSSAFFQALNCLDATCSLVNRFGAVTCAATCAKKRSSSDQASRRSISYEWVHIWNVRSCRQE